MRNYPLSRPSAHNCQASGLRLVLQLSTPPREGKKAAKSTTRKRRKINIEAHTKMVEGECKFINILVCGEFITRYLADYCR